MIRRPHRRSHSLGDRALPSCAPAVRVHLLASVTPRYSSRCVSTSPTVTSQFLLDIGVIGAYRDPITTPLDHFSGTWPVPVFVIVALLLIRAAVALSCPGFGAPICCSADTRSRRFGARARTSSGRRHYFQVMDFNLGSRVRRWLAGRSAQRSRGGQSASNLGGPACGRCL